jgi:hypothetical protein
MNKITFDFDDTELDMDFDEIKMPSIMELLCVEDMMSCEFSPALFRSMPTVTLEDDEFDMEHEDIFRSVPIVSKSAASSAFELPMLSVDDFVNEYCVYYIKSSVDKTTTFTDEFVMEQIMDTLKSLGSVLEETRSKNTFSVYNNCSGHRLGSFCAVYRSNPSLCRNDSKYMIEFSHNSGDRWAHVTLAETFLNKLSEKLNLETNTGMPCGTVTQETNTFEATNTASLVSDEFVACIDFTLEQCRSGFSDAKSEGVCGLAGICASLLSATHLDEKIIALIAEKKIVNTLVCSALSWDANTKLYALHALHMMSSHPTLCQMMVNAGAAGMLRSMFNSSKQSMDILIQREAIQLLTALSMIPACDELLRSLKVREALTNSARIRSCHDPVIQHGVHQATMSMCM